MNERERLLLHEMIGMARNKLIQVGIQSQGDKSIRMTDFINESSRILGVLEKIYDTPFKKDVETK